LPLIPQVCGTGIPANKKIQTLGANHQSDLRIAWFHINMKFMFALNLNKYPEYFPP
jgi:hypothetical protein